jgi:apolipoprotein N-acyltransferase
MFTILNATRLALMQVGVLTIGVLGAGLRCKFSAMDGWQPPGLTRLAFDYGFISFLLPLVWITVAVLVHRSELSDMAKNMVFLSGAGLAVLMIICFVIIDFVQ